MEQFKIVGDYENIDWEKLLKVLISYAFVLLEDHCEMKKSREDLAYDAAMEAISKYIEGESKFDPSKNPDLVKFLKYYHVRQIISNKKKSGRYKYESSSDDIVDSSLLSTDQFIKDYKIDEKIDVDQIVLQIEETIGNDNELLPIFKGRYYQDSKRSEICDDLNISTKEYDNRIKRLRRIVAKIKQTAHNHE